MILHIEENEITKKQFMGNREHVEVVIPSHVSVVGDWAFAYCKNLECIFIPIQLVRFGKEVFLGCEKLERVYVYDEKPLEGMERAELSGNNCGKEKESGLANANCFAEDLQAKLWKVCLVDWKTPVWDETEEDRAIWMEKWDVLCGRYLSEPDLEGFAPFLAGGEEDYSDQSTDSANYCHKKRMNKVFCVATRLLLAEEYPIQLDRRKEFIEYLDRQFQTEGENCETWEFLLKEEEHLPELVKCYEKSGLFTKERLQKVISLTPDGKVELKAMLMKLQKAENNVWADFCL